MTVHRHRARPTMNRRAIPTKPAKADLSRLCTNSAGVHPRAGEVFKGIK
jgi:hypothetical protein